MFLTKLFGKKTKEKTFTLEVKESDIATNQNAKTKDDVFKILSDLMVKNGYVDAPYNNALKQREEQANTFLGNGIAIPHGRIEDKALIKKTGVVIAQFKQGVAWGESGNVFLAVGIVAKGDEHLKILTKLTQIVTNESLALELGKNADTQAILNAFNNNENAKTNTVTKESVNKEELKQTALVKEKSGLHARPSSAIVKLAKSFEDTKITISYNGKTVSADSLVNILSLGVKHNESVEIATSGKNAEQALKKMCELIEKD